MILKIFGALLIIVACSSFGVFATSSHRKSVKAMQQLLGAITFIEHELQYRMSSLPDIFHQTAAYCKGPVGRFFGLLADELEKQIAPDIGFCIEAALSQTEELPLLAKKGIHLLGKSLGRFDVENQLEELAIVRTECTSILSSYTDNQEVRLRSYQTLALCAGAAVAILLI